MNRREWLEKVGGATAGTLMSQLVGTGTGVAAQESPRLGVENDTGRWLEIAESLKPTLRESVHVPLHIVRPVADSSRILRWRMEIVAPGSEIEKKLFRRGDNVTVDFGEHRTGYLSFTLRGEGVHMDAPTRLRLTFGEVPGDVAEDFYPYKGQLSEAWLPDEVFDVDDLPQTVRFPRVRWAAQRN